MLRELFRPLGQLCGDKEQAPPRHLAAANDAAHPHPDDPRGDQQRGLGSALQSAPPQEEGVHRRHQEVPSVARVLKQVYH